MSPERADAVDRLNRAYAQNNIPPIDEQDIRTLRIHQIIGVAEYWEKVSQACNDRVNLSDLCHVSRNALSRNTNTDGLFDPRVRFGLGKIALRDDGGNWA